MINEQVKAAGTFRPVTWFLLSILGAAAIIIHLPFVTKLAWPDLSLFQVCAFPLALWLTSRLVINKTSVPGIVLLAVAICAALAVGFSYAHISEVDKAFLVARLQGDPYEVDSRVLRERINYYLRTVEDQDDVRATRHPGAPTRSKDVAHFLKKNEEFPALVWGSTAWLNLSLDSRRNGSLPEEHLQPWIALSGLRPVSSIPIVGFSLEPREDTAAFLAALFSGLAGLSALEPLENDEFTDAEESLLAAAYTWGRWSTAHHRSFPLWVIGNLYLSRGLWDGRFEAGDIRCAVSNYSKALAFLGDYGNPELVAAIYNNRALAYFATSLVSESLAFRKLALKDLKRAASLVRKRDPFGVGLRAPKIARSNLAAVRERSGRKPAGRLGADRSKLRRNKR
jgi:hypothetical protein